MEVNKFELNSNELKFNIECKECGNKNPYLVLSLEYHPEYEEGNLVRVPSSVLAKINCRICQDTQILDKVDLKPNSENEHPSFNSDSSLNYIYAVYKNSDMTEGRGPSIIDSLFLDKVEAEKYMDEQPGVMGIRKKWSKQEYGDWFIRALKVYHSAEEKFVDESNGLRKKALSKLSKEEKKALNLE